MKHHLESLLNQALQQLQQTGKLPAELSAEAKVERTRDRQHGDFASNLAMTLTKAARRKPRDLAEMIKEAIPTSSLVVKVEIAGPGFINFFLTPGAYQKTVADILTAGEAYGRSSVGAQRPIQVEFVSANPTGPLHVGHGRGAAYGAAVANLLEAAGFGVHREYYVNDAGRQMDILAASVWLRYLEALGESFAFPANGYKGGYVRDIAAALQRIHGDKFHRPAAQVMAELPADAPVGGDKEEHIDAIIERAKTLLGAADYRTVFDAGLKLVLSDIREDLQEFGVIYDEWYSERSLTESGAVTRALERLKASGHAYEQDGALW